MSYFGYHLPRPSSVPMSAQELFDCLQYNRMLRQLEPLEESQHGQDGFARIHPSYVPWPRHRPRRRNHWHPHLYLPANINTPDPGVAAVHPGYVPWPQRSRYYHNHYHSHVHRTGSLGYPGAYDPYWPNSYDNSGADHQYLSASPYVGLPGPRQPWPHPPVRPLPPPSGPRPGPQPRPPPQPIPGPKRQQSHQSTFPEYFAPSAGSDSGFPSESSAGKSLSSSAHAAQTKSVGISTPQPTGYRRASVEDADSESEGTRTPTQNDYTSNNSDSGKDINSQKAPSTNEQTSGSTSVGKNEPKPENVQQKAEAEHFRSRHRSDLASWRRRAHYGRLPSEFPYWKTDEAKELKYDPSTGRFEAVEDAAGTKAEKSVAAEKGVSHGGDDQQGEAGKYDFQVPRSPN